MPLADLGRHPESVQRDVLLAMLTELEFNTLLKRVTTPGWPARSAGSQHPSVLPQRRFLSQRQRRNATATTPAAATPPPNTTTATTAAPMPPVESPALTESAAPSAAVELAAWIAATPGAPGAAVARCACGLATRGPAFASSAWPGVSPDALWRGDTPAKAAVAARRDPGRHLALHASAPAAYLPLSHRYLGAPTQLSPAEAVSQLAIRCSLIRRCASSSTAPRMCCCCSAAMGRARSRASSLIPPCARISSMPGRDHSLDGLVEKHLPPDYPKLLSREALCRAGGKHGVPFDQVDIAAAADFAVAQARATYLLSALLWPRLDSAAQQLLSRLELPLARVLSVIEQHGNSHRCRCPFATQPRGRQQAGVARVRIATLAGARINLNSPKQLAELLFDKLGLEPVKRRAARPACRSITRSWSAGRSASHRAQDHRVPQPE